MHGLARLFVGSVAANLVMLALIIRVYAEPFSLVMDPLSWLGKIETAGGVPNTVAFLLFSATLLVDACIWRKVLTILPGNGEGRFTMGWLLGRGVLAGFILMAFPCDRFVVVHNIGAGLVVGGFWALATGMLYRSRDKLGAGVHLGLQLILHFTALYCGVNFAWDTPLKGFSQRPLLLAIIADTGLCLKRAGLSTHGRSESRSFEHYSCG